MDAKWYKIASAVLGTLIGSACGETVDSGTGGAGAAAGTGGDGLGTSTSTGVGGGMTAEYGMPMAHFVVSGTVVAEDGGDPIEGIEVGLDEAYDTTTSDQNGEFSLSVDSYAFCSTDPCSTGLTATDVDGPAQGGDFATTVVSVALDQTDPGGGTWDDGTWEAHDVEVAMPAAGAGGSGTGGGGDGGS